MVAPPERLPVVTAALQMVTVGLVHCKAALGGWLLCWLLLWCQWRLLK